MLECYEYFTGADAKALSVAADAELRLVFQDRQRSRCRARAVDGREVAWFVERGVVLCDGDVLSASSGETVLVLAAEETLSVVTSNDALLLCRAAYHLGNRHMPLQVLEGELRYQHDHVLDDMVRGLGLSVEVAQRPFQPENGAYHGSGHGHAHGHSHSNSHGNGHSHGHSHRDEHAHG